MADLPRDHTVIRPCRDPRTTGFLIAAIGARAIEVHFCHNGVGYGRRPDEAIDRIATTVASTTRTITEIERTESGKETLDHNPFRVPKASGRRR
jgi:hypothetical protein